MKQQKNKNKLNKMKMLMLTGIITLCFLTTSFSGCIQPSGATIEKDDLGPGLKQFPDGSIGIDPDMFGDNLVYDGYNLSSIDTVGGGDGYRSDSSIEYVVESMTHNSMNFANNSVFDALGLIRTSNGRLYTATASNLQTAVWSLNGTGGTIHLPVCNITATNAPIEIHDGIHIIGSTKNGTSGTYITGITGKDLFHIVGDDGMTSSGSIRNIALTQPDSTGIGVHVDNADFFTIDNCLFTRFNNAIRVANHSYHCKITNNRLIMSQNVEVYIKDFANGLEISGNDFAPDGTIKDSMSIYASEVYDNRTSHIQILNNWFEYGTGNGSHIVGGFTDSLIQGNSIGNTNGVGTGINISTFDNANGYETIISDNRISCGNDGDGISTRDGGSCNGLIVDSNTISNCKNGLKFTTTGIPQVISNFIYNNAARGIKFSVINGGGIACNNRIFNNGDDGVYEATKVTDNYITGNSGYGVYRCSHVCSGNYISGNTDGGIMVIDSELLISDNKINGNTGTGLYLHAVSKNCSIQDNIFRDYDGNPQTKGLDDDGDYNFISDNDFSKQGGTTIDSLGSNSIAINNDGFNHNSLFPFYEQNTAPSINDNCTAYWYDTDDDYMYQVVNTYGTVYYVNMTTSI